MRDFSKVQPAIWDNPKFIGLPSDHHRLCVMYLTTCRHVTSAGVAFLPPAYGASDLRWTVEVFNARLAEIIAADFAQFDRATNEVLLLDWFEWNPPMNESHYRGTLHAISRIASPDIRASAGDALAKAWQARAAAKIGEEARGRLSLLTPIRGSRK